MIQCCSPGLNGDESLIWTEIIYKDEEVDAELSSDEEIEEPNTIGSDSEWSCIGSETYSCVHPFLYYSVYYRTSRLAIVGLY